MADKKQEADKSGDNGWDKDRQLADQTRAAQKLKEDYEKLLAESEKKDDQLEKLMGMVEKTVSGQEQEQKPSEPDEYQNLVNSIESFDPVSEDMDFEEGLGTLKNQMLDVVKTLKPNNNDDVLTKLMNKVDGIEASLASQQEQAAESKMLSSLDKEFGGKYRASAKEQVAKDLGDTKPSDLPSHIVEKLYRSAYQAAASADDAPDANATENSFAPPAVEKDASGTLDLLSGSGKDGMDGLEQISLKDFGSSNGMVFGPTDKE